MKISIAMATYNGEKYIQEQLDSFLVQTRLPDELIVTDDCSSDSTEEIVKNFAAQAPFRVLFQRNEKNLGYCGNFNQALMRTTGDLVFLSDQDDVWFPNKIETMVGLAENNQDMLVLMNDAELTDGELNPVGLTKLGQIKSAGLSQKSYVMGCCCAVRRDLLDICMPIPEGFRGHDNWLVEFADGLDAKYVDHTVLQYYRRHESNESQFIANRTVKIGKYDLLKEQMRKVMTAKLRNQNELQTQQIELLIAGISRAAERRNDKKSYLDKMFSKKTKSLEEIKARQKIRQLNLIPRFFAVAICLLKGKYRSASGIKSAAKDFLG